MIVSADNGISGTWGVIDDNENAYIFKVPIKKTLNYQKTKVANITRIDTNKLTEILKSYINDVSNVKVYLERPMVNPGRFVATASALRALEATLIVLENLQLGVNYIDSKAWQRKLLPQITKEQKKREPKILKRLSLEIGKRLFPKIDWSEFDDADGLLIAEYIRRKEGS